MKKTLRTLAAYALALVGWVTLLKGVGLAIFGFYFLHEAESMAEDNVAAITTRLIPHLKSPKNHYGLVDLADMQRVNSQVTADMLSGVQSLFIAAGLCFLVTLLCALLLRWFFPDWKELFKTWHIPGVPASWQRPLRLWRPRDKSGPG